MMRQGQNRPQLSQEHRNNKDYDCHRNTEIIKIKLSQNTEIIKTKAVTGTQK